MGSKRCVCICSNPVAVAYNTPATLAASAILRVTAVYDRFLSVLCWIMLHMHQLHYDL